MKKYTEQELLEVNEAEDHIFLWAISRKAKIYEGADFLMARSRKANVLNPLSPISVQDQFSPCNYPYWILGLIKAARFLGQIF